MPHTLDSALEDPDITVLQRDDHLGFFEVRVGGLNPVVTIDLARALGSNETKFDRSHNIKTPVQSGPYISSRLFWDDPAYALHQAISGLTSHYRAAVKAGHIPNDSWLMRRGEY